MEKEWTIILQVWIPHRINGCERHILEIFTRQSDTIVLLCCQLFKIRSMFLEWQDNLLGFIQETFNWTYFTTSVLLDSTFQDRDYFYNKLCTYLTISHPTWIKKLGNYMVFHRDRYLSLWEAVGRHLTALNNNFIILYGNLIVV